ncbi:hypothetical protein MRX96_013890 [Rhipicephalus microplus]|uniref:Putative secreted protein n=1 Tax=Rhipicephalus microplus TaxID=6941 RepID=A0A6G5ADT0_RHIMP
MKRHLSKILLNWPGRKTFGPYCFMPVFFIFGAALELAMIKWTPGGKTNFYVTFKRRLAKNIVSHQSSQ